MAYEKTMEDMYRAVREVRQNSHEDLSILQDFECFSPGEHRSAIERILIKAYKAGWNACSNEACGCIGDYEG